MNLKVYTNIYDKTVYILLWCLNNFDEDSVCLKYCKQGNILPVLFSPVSPSLSTGKFKTVRIPISQFKYSEHQREWAFKTGRNCLKV